jgi:glutamate synthase (NADPH/NADH) large chain
MVKEGELDIQITSKEAIKNYIKSCDDGLLKIFSKMGISTFQSYQGAQIYEAIGLKMDFVDKYFEGIQSRIEGVGIKEVEKETLEIHKAAFKKISSVGNLLSVGGEYQWRRHGEIHLWNPETIFNMHMAIRTNSWDHWNKFCELVDNQDRRHVTIRSLLKFKKVKPIPIEEVESAQSIVKRFCVSAMSFGAISKEAHESLAIAMNRLGAMANSGEGGEDPIRFKPYANGDFKPLSCKRR